MPVVDPIDSTSANLERTRGCLQRSRAFVAHSLELIARTSELIHKSNELLVRADQVVGNFGPLRSPAMKDPGKALVVSGLDERDY